MWKQLKIIRSILCSLHETTESRQEICAILKLRSHKEHSTDHSEGKTTMMEVQHNLPGNKAHT